ncbi:MAG: exopolysaccharide biosynthesis polyprenyl glycosylphosphotransferase, partial [Hyphomicrobiaceae bacterium]
MALVHDMLASTDWDGGVEDAKRRADMPRSISLPVLWEVLSLVEAGIVFLSAILAKLIYINGYLHSSQATLPYAGVGVVGAVIAVVVFRHLDSHNPVRLLRQSIASGTVLFGLCVCMLLLLSLFYLFKVSDDYSRGWMLTWLGVAFIAMLAERGVVSLYTRALVAEGRLVQRVAIYGTKELGEQVRDNLETNNRVRVVGLFEDHRDLRLVDDDQPSGDLGKLIAFGQENEIDRIIVALPPDDHDRLSRVLDEISVLPHEVDLCPEVLTLPCHSYSTRMLGKLRLFEVHRPPLNAQDLLSKTIFDYAIAAVTAVLLLPLFAVVAIAIKLESKGPVLFVQRRHGYNHRVIHVFKFRTMSVMQDGPEIEQTKKDDDRVTRVGRFLRRTSIDELPQLVNVLKGEMSLVGPRPHALAHNDL